MTKQEVSQESTGMRQGERRHAKLVAPFAQDMLNTPSQAQPQLQNLARRAPLEAPHILIPGQMEKTLLDPPSAVLVHLMTTQMLPDTAGMPVAPPPSHAAPRPVIAAMSPAVWEARKTYEPQRHQEFIGALLETVNPYFESVIGEVMDPSHSYFPVWREYSRLAPLWVDALTDPMFVEYTEKLQHRNPINSLYNTVWEAAVALPKFAEELPSLVDADGITSVGQFQTKALEQGIVGFLAKGSEIPRPTRERRVEDDRLRADTYGRDPDTKILTYDDHLTRAIAAELSRCAGTYGLLDSSPQIRQACRRHNDHVGPQNRSTASFYIVDKSADPLDVVSSTEVFAYLTLLVAPSTLWQKFLQEKGITDWNNALPGTRLPNGTIFTGKGNRRH